MGVRLLRVEGTVLLAPARLREESPSDFTSTVVVPPANHPAVEPGTCLAEAHRLLLRNGERLRLLQ